MILDCEDNIYYFSVQTTAMQKKLNLICLLISLLPVIVLLFVYNASPAFVNTKISGGNGMIISKNTFVFIIIGLSFLWYYLSLFISQRLTVLTTVISQFNLRGIINLLFSILSIWLILSNL